MNRDDKNPRGKIRSAEEMRKVRELYRQADLKYGGFAAPEQEKFDALSPAVSSGGAPVDDDQSEMANPTWILNVLEDMISFCVRHEYTEVADTLDSAKQAIAAQLAQNDDR